MIFKEWMCFAYGPMAAAAAAHEEEAFSGHQRELITSSDKILFLKFIIRKREQQRKTKVSLYTTARAYSILVRSENTLERETFKKQANYDSH